MKYTRRRYKTRKNVRRKTRRGGAFANRGRAGRNADCREFLAKPAVIAFMKQYLKKKSGKFNPTLEDLKRVEIKFDELKEAYPDLASCYLDRYQMKSARNTWIDQLFPGKNQNVKAVKLNAVKNLPRLPVRGPIVAPVGAPVPAVANRSHPFNSPYIAIIEQKNRAYRYFEEITTILAVARREDNPNLSIIENAYSEAETAYDDASHATTLEAATAAAKRGQQARISARDAAEAPTLFSSIFGSPHISSLAARLAAARRGTPPDPTHTVAAPTSRADQQLNAQPYNAENPPGEDLISELRNEQLGRTGIQEYKDLFQYVDEASIRNVVNTFNLENDEGLLYRIATYLTLLYQEYYNTSRENLELYSSLLTPLSAKVDALVSNTTLPESMKNTFERLKAIIAERVSSVVNSESGGLNLENPNTTQLIEQLRNPQLGRTGIEEYKNLYQYVNRESMTHVVNTFNLENDQGLLFRIAKFLTVLYDDYPYHDSTNVYQATLDEDDYYSQARLSHFLSPLSTKVDDLLRNNTLPRIIKSEFQKLKNILPAPEGYLENVDG